MALGAFLPLIVFVLIAGSVALRLTALWRRTRGVPEGSLGLGLLLVTLAMPLCAVGRVPGIAMEPIGRSSFAVGLCTAAIGIALLANFNLHVFRRDAGWARALFAVIVLLVIGSAAFMCVANTTGKNVVAIKDAMRPGTLTLMGAVLGCFAWGAAESLLCHRASRRRLVLGMGDPIVVNRFLLWGLASLACAALLIVTIGCVMAGMVILHEPIPLAAIAGCGIIMSSCWYLTFFPPVRYRNLVLERSGSRLAAPER